MNNGVQKRSRSHIAFGTAFSVAALAVAGLSLSVQAMASAAIVSLTSDAFPGQTYKLEVNQNAQDAIAGMIYQTDTGSTSLSVVQLEKGPQAVFKDQGHNIIELSLDSDFNAQKGGHIEMRFYTNALFGQYKNFRILADVQGSDVVLRSSPNAADPHSDHNPYNGIIHSLNFVKGSLGVSSIQAR